LRGACDYPAGRVYQLLLSISRSAIFRGWGTLALINAGLAQGKNKSGLFWFLISIFLGPLATLVLVLLPRA
jgi:hypothetical protein